MKLFGYSISLNVLILIGVLYLIMVVNALSGSCNREGMKTQAEWKAIKKTIEGIKGEIEIAKTQNAPNKLTVQQKTPFRKRLSQYSGPATAGVERAYFEADQLLKNS
jgi:hypothetical protein